MYKNSVKLANGIEVPQLALGTWLINDNDVVEAIKTAIDMGYEHIDTAQAYRNERGVGEGIRQSKVHRNKLFITSKVAAEHKDYRSATASIEETLNKIELDYIDMMLIHSPQPWAEVNQSENRYVEGNREAWRALEDAYKSGKIRAIGISNFLEEDIEKLWETAEIKPMVNQILCHISNTPFALIDYCESKGIVLEAYSPIAHGEALKNPKIKEMAEKYGVSIAQLCVRYDLQLGMITLPKTSNPNHMKNNAEVDFEISEEDMDVLKRIERIKDYGEHGYFPVYGGKL